MRKQIVDDKLKDEIGSCSVHIRTWRMLSWVSVEVKCMNFGALSVPRTGAESLSATRYI